MNSMANTSANNIVKSLVEKADILVKKELEDLLAGGTIEKPIHEDITYDSVYDSEDNLWNFLFFAGYLRQISRRLDKVTQYVTMGIPNLEVEYIYQNTISSWFKEEIRERDLTVMYRAIQEGDACGRALRQIREKEYDSWLPEEGYTEVWNYGIAFFRKQCKIQAEHRDLA